MKPIVPSLALGVFGALSGAMVQGPAAKEASAKKAAQPVYTGSRVCRKCHTDQYKTWKKAKMTKAFELLKPGVRAEAKVKAKLDPDKDYSRDETCLPCHVTGWGKPGGYAIPPQGDSPEARKAQKLARSMEGVQCEACHGPGSLVVAYKKKKEDYTWADIVKKGLTEGVSFPTKERCLGCHNDESPFVDKGTVFDFATRKSEGTHRHYRMDFDHGCPHKHTVTKKKKKKKKKKKS
ncbi:MAG: cytochrome c family protein [Planctomycetota bacterium]